MDNIDVNLKLAEKMPDAAFEPVTTFTPPELDADVLDALTFGKDDIKAGDKDNIEIPVTDPKDKGKEKETKDSNKKPDSDDDSDDDELNNDLDANNVTSSESEDLNLSDLITPDMALDIFSLILVTAGLILIPKFLHVDVEKNELELTADEKKVLRKPLKKVFESTAVKTKNPMAALLIALTAVMGTKAAVIYNNHLDRKKEEEKRSNERHNYLEYDDDQPAPRAKVVPLGKKSNDEINQRRRERYKERKEGGVQPRRGRPRKDA